MIDSKSCYFSKSLWFLVLVIVLVLELFTEGFARQHNNGTKWFEHRNQHRHLSVINQDSSSSSSSNGGGENILTSHIHLGKLLERLNQPLDPVVDASVSKLGSAYHRGNLCPFKLKIADKMMRNENIKILIVGGSVTFGAELRNRMRERWSAHFDEILNSGWYSGKFEVQNIGVGACNVDVWINRVKEASFSQADMIIIDLSVNDQGFDLQLLPHLYDTFIQLLDSLPNHPAIYFFQAFRGAKMDLGDIQHHCPGEGNYVKCCQGEMFCRRWYEMQDFVSIALHKYRIPFVSYRDLVWPDYLHPPNNLNQFWNGMSHPDYKAHALIAKLYAYGFMMQIKELHHHTANCNQAGHERYIPRDSLDQKNQPICFKYLSHMAAGDSFDSVKNFHFALGDTSSKNITSSLLETISKTGPGINHWRYYNDSQLKFGWILETDKDKLQDLTKALPTGSNTAICTPAVLTDSKHSLNEVCKKLIASHEITFSINLSQENPKFQLTFLRSYDGTMGDAAIWVDSHMNESVVLSGKWDEAYSVSRLVTISRDELINVSSFIKGDSKLMKSLLAGEHQLHISLINFDLNKLPNYKWKLLGISSC